MIRKALAVIAAAVVGLATASVYAGDPPVSMSGKWNTDFGLAEISEDGDNVTGSYPFESGKIFGTRSGNRLTGQWIQSISTAKCNTAVNGSYYHGRLVFDFALRQGIAYVDDVRTGECPPWVASSFSGTYLPLAGQVETWSDAKLFVRRSGPITVQSRFMGQHGTTCKFEVQFNNIGTKAIDESLIIARPGKAEVSQYDMPLRAKLAPGASVAYGTEVRECPLIWGKSQDMTKCAACEPMVYFIGN